MYFMLSRCSFRNTDIILNLFMSILTADDDRMLIVNELLFVCNNVSGNCSKRVHTLLVFRTMHSKH